MILGIDEVGKGPLGGPVSVCVVACEYKIYRKLKNSKYLPVVGKDSKKLKPEERNKFDKILKSFSKEGKIFYAVTHIGNKTIDSQGIVFAIKKAMSSSLKKLGFDAKNCRVLLDGNLKAPDEFLDQQTIIKGDEKEKIIAWASILAKVSRDKLMCQLSKKFPVYGFDSHKGYGTKGHRSLIELHGISELHRRTFCRNLKISIG